MSDHEKISNANDNLAWNSLKKVKFAGESTPTYPGNPKFLEASEDSIFKDRIDEQLRRMPADAFVPEMTSKEDLAEALLELSKDGGYDMESPIPDSPPENMPDITPPPSPPSER